MNRRHRKKDEKKEGKKQKTSISVSRPAINSILDINKNARSLIKHPE
jgi:hypothetical protein